MDYVRASIAPLSLITPAGLNHPYYSYKPSTYQTAEAMFARITSYPPLDDDFVVPYGQDLIPFTVLLETEVEQPTLEVQIWHNLNDLEIWEALDLSRSAHPKFTVVQSQPNLFRTWHKGILPGKKHYIGPISFTVRFRTGPKDGWKWAHDQTGVDDGRLIFQPSLKTIAEHEALSTYIDGTSSDIKVQGVPSEVPNTRLWSLTAPVKGATGQNSGYTTHRFGRSNWYRWFALVRLWSPWLAPRQGGKTAELAEKDAILYSFLRNDGLHVVLLAISGIDDVSTVFQADWINLNIHSRNDREQEGTARVVVAVAGTFAEGIAACMYYARRVMSDYNVVTKDDQEAVNQLKALEAKSQAQNDKVGATWMQSWNDSLTYCTWNGLGQNLTEEKISSALSSLEENGIKISNLILDDNWQDLDNEGENQMMRGWKDFTANPKGFPEGLDVAISRIRKKYPAIQHIAVWHALLGYWGGISPSGRLAKDYATRQVLKSANVIAKGSDKMLVIDQPDVKRMYDDFYTFLNKSGIDAVKTDAQFMLDEIQNASARRDLTNTYTNTWISAQLRHFGGLAISCMSQTPSILFRCQLPTDIPAYPTRNSDDFFPHVEESHPWHIFCNAHNSLFTKHLNVLPDWDMFQTSHPWATFHATARCISGGPIYITDTPGHHNLPLLTQMTAQTIRSQTIILRPSVVGRSTSAYIGFEEERLVKVAAYSGRSGTGTGFLGLFNCRKEGVTEVISAGEFLGTKSMGMGVVVRSHGMRVCSGVLRGGAGGAEGDVFAVQVDGHGCDVLSASPVYRAEGLSKNQELQVANLGLLGKMTGGAAILETRYSVHSASASASDAPADTEDYADVETSHAITAQTQGRDSLVIKTSLKALGTLGLWLLLAGNDASQTKAIDIDGDVMVLLEGRAVPRHCVSLASASGDQVERAGESQGAKSEGADEAQVLQVDLTTAWREMGLRAGYANEVDVAVYVWV